MANLAYILSGAAPVVKKFQIGVTLTDAGIPFTVPASGTAGVVIGTTTGATDLVGLSLDTASGAYVTGQQTDGTSTERLVSLIVNPDAVWSWKMSGGATENTELAAQTVTTASTTGLAVTTAAEWSNPTYDEGVTWGFTGANAGKYRKVTSVSSTAGTVTVAFDYDTVVGDVFLRAPYWPMQTVTIQLSTLLTQADASIAVGTGAPFRVIELILKDASDSGKSNSFVYGISNSHALNLA